MKKKILSSLLAAALVMGCCACGKNESSETKKKKKTKKTSEKTESVTSDPDETEDTEPSITTEEPTEPKVDPSDPVPGSSVPDLDADFGDLQDFEGAKRPIPSNIGFGNGEQDDLTAKLLEDDRVLAAEKKTKYQDQSYYDKYVVFWDMPLDWENPDAGSFLLRSELILDDPDAPMTFECDGYMITGQWFDFDFKDAIPERYETNEIRCEHRFFGASIPEGLSNISTDLWQYLTAENAAADFHYIIETYKSIFTGNTWIFTGGSKGGQLTHMQSHFYPDDADVYMSFVAPGGCAQDAPDFFDFIYTGIGDDMFGADVAEEKRGLVLEFQVEAMKHKSELADRYYQLGMQNGDVFNDFTTPEILYDMAVLDFATIFWQYYPDFTTLERILDMDRSTGAFADELFDYLCLMNMPDVWAVTSDYFPYYVQAARQNGEHEYDFSYLRDALAEEGLDSLLTVTEDMEEGLLYKMVFTPEQLDAFTFDDTLYNDMVEWSHTTDNLVIMIYGADDVWYTVRLPDVDDNDNIYRFVGKGSSHMVMIDDLEASEIQKIDELVRSALGLS